MESTYSSDTDSPLLMTSPIGQTKANPFWNELPQSKIPWTTREPRPATAADEIADGLLRAKNKGNSGGAACPFHLMLLIQLPDNQVSISEDRVSPCGKHYTGTIIQELEEGWRDTPKSPTINPQRFRERDSKALARSASWTC
ncbi:hypothetical protein ACFE04_008387 [Oxalis oulophora]